MKKISFLATVTVLAIAVSFLAASRVEAVIINWMSPMVGITMSQTARLNVVNVSDLEDREARPCMVMLMFFDDMGDMLGDSMMVDLMPGHAAFHDLMGAEFVREGERLQIRAEAMALGGPDTKCDIRSSLEVFDNTTMETEVFIGDPNQ